MPTGYTHKIAEGQSFEDFVLGCALAFGAFIVQGDSKPEKGYHADSLSYAQAKLDNFLNMTEDEKYNFGQTCIEERIYSINERIQKNNALQEKYNAMLEKVGAWTPPSVKHEELKQFMINQIQQSIDFDCNNSYNYDELKKIQSFTPVEYYKLMVDSVLWDIRYHSKKCLEYTERNLSRNKWIRELYESLNISI